jgi:hypothetical protein
MELGKGQWFNEKRMQLFQNARPLEAGELLTPRVMSAPQIDLPVIGQQLIQRFHVIGKGRIWMVSHQGMPTNGTIVIKFDQQRTVTAYAEYRLAMASHIWLVLITAMK